MQKGNCVYFQGFLFEKSCKKAVDLRSTWGHPKTQLADRVPCISGGDNNKRGSCPLHQYPTTGEKSE